MAYTQTILASGGTPPYTAGVTGGALPPGLTLTSAGVLSGTPTTVGTSTFTITKIDANGCAAAITYTMNLAAAPVPPPVCPVIALSPLTLPNGMLGVAYNHVLTASGGTGPYSVGATGGALPPGVTLSAVGVLAGTPTSSGTTAFVIRATDAADASQNTVHASGGDSRRADPAADGCRAARRRPRCRWVRAAATTGVVLPCCLRT